MAANQAIVYAPRCDDLTIESLTFHNNNVVVVYQNFLREFWCTAIAYDPNPPTDNSKDIRPENCISCGLENFVHISYSDTKVDIREIINSDLVTRLTNKSSDPTSFYCKEEEREVSDCKKSDPKNSVGNIQSIDMRLPSMVSNKGMVKITSLPEGLHGDKDSEENKAPADIKPINPTIIDLLGTGAKYQDEMAQESDDEEVFVVGEDMDVDTHADEEEYQQLVKYLRKVSKVLFKRITEEEWAQHIEAAVSYADLIASIIGYYEKNVDHKEKTNKVIEAIQDAIKVDPILNKKVI
nr:hypothetical protein [Tanacetum cinerariifolium]